MARTKLHPARKLLLSALAAAAGCASIPQSDGVLRSGLVVEKVGADSLAAKAGVEVDDTLLSWRRGDVGGVLISPVDLDQVEVEEAPRGGLALEGRRGEEAVSFAMGDGSWGLEVRPRLGDQADQALSEARQTGGAEGVEQLQALARQEDRPAVRAWLLVLAAEAVGVDTGKELWAEAVASAGGDAATKTWVNERRGHTLEDASRFDEAAAAYTRALESMAEGSLGAAASLDNLGNVAEGRGDLGAAEEYHRRALEIVERLAPDTIRAASILNSLGIVAGKRGDLEAEERCFVRALDIEERLSPGSISVASSLNNLGSVAFNRGDLEAALRYVSRALDIRKRLVPGSLEVAASLSNLGILSRSRGDLEVAQRYHLEALAIRERLAPGSHAVAVSLNNLGVVAIDRGDLEAALRYLSRALEIRERLAPGSLDVAMSLNNLGAAARSHGDLEAAQRYYLRALEIQERAAPDSLELAASLNNLSNVVDDRGDPEAARRYLSRALEIQERLTPGSLEVAKSLHNLGVMAGKRGDLEAAEGYHRRALEIWNRLAPGSADEASALQALAFVLRSANRRSEALDALRRAVKALEAQQHRLGGTAEQLGEFRAQHLDIYRDLVDLLLEERLPEEAYGVLESARARAMLAMLAERDIVAVDVAPELERERRLANADHDRTMAALGRLQSADEEERVRLLAQLDGIRQRQEDIRARVREASPRLAALRYPEPLDLAATRQALEPGTLLLEYSLGKDSSHLFVVGPGPDHFAVYSLPIGEEALREQVTRLRRLIQWSRVTPNAGVDEANREAFREPSRSLAATLLEPAESEIAQCSRVVIVPDGPLHLLPFAALLDPTASYERYLVESKPISVVASATVLAQLQRQRRPPREMQLTAFGDPSYPAASAGEISPALEHAVRNGLSLDPLPASRAEVEGLGRLFGDHATLWLGPEATEERAKAVGEGVTILHFASHGMVDERRPLSSALALTIPEQAVEGQDNGLLQAWEVFEQVRLDADLVVLSACETALGKEEAGEGILGLTRAFQYAGARSVLASLWSVADESTAELMQRFYASLKAGMPKDEALRAAQLAFIRGPLEPAQGDAEAPRDLSPPFYWAAFQLYGDWR